jgi:hypothetical protein
MGPARVMIRLFRADKPHDVAAASLIADLDRERHDDLLLLGADKTSANPPEYLAAMRAMASVRHWRAIGHVSDLPINARWIDRQPRLSRLAEIRALKTSARQLRTIVAEMLSGVAAELDDIDEVCVSNLAHPDVLLLCDMLPRARVTLLPHGFTSLAPWEIAQYGSHIRGDGPSNTRLRNAVRFAKHVAFGRDAALRGYYPVHRCYTFREQCPWAEHNTDISHLLTAEQMRLLLDRLPSHVRNYFTTLASELGPDVGIVLPRPEWAFHDTITFETQMRGLELATAGLLEPGDVATLLVKPHPISDRDWIARAVDHLRSTFDVRCEVVDYRYRFLPAEIVLSPIDVRGITGLGSSALRTLPLIHGWNVHYPEALEREIYGSFSSRSEKET